MIKKILVLVISITSLAFMISISTFAAPKKIVMGFSQLGPESKWRTAETNSIKHL